MVDKSGYELEFEDAFDGTALDSRRWFPYYLPRSSPREQSAARFRLGDGVLRLLIEAEPHRSAEICICEIFGRDVKPDSAAVGMGVHPFGDPTITDEFAAEVVHIDAREFHPTRANGRLTASRSTSTFNESRRSSSHPAIRCSPRACAIS